MNISILGLSPWLEWALTGQPGGDLNAVSVFWTKASVLHSVRQTCSDVGLMVTNGDYITRYSILIHRRHLINLFGPLHLLPGFKVLFAKN